jgi:hypothetical protein
MEHLLPQLALSIFQAKSKTITFDELAIEPSSWSDIDCAPI